MYNIHIKVQDIEHFYRRASVSVSWVHGVGENPKEKREKGPGKVPTTYQKEEETRRKSTKNCGR